MKVTTVLCLGDPGTFKGGGALHCGLSRGAGVPPEECLDQLEKRKDGISGRKDCKDKEIGMAKRTKDSMAKESKVRRENVLSY